MKQFVLLLSVTLVFGLACLTALPAAQSQKKTHKGTYEVFTVDVYFNLITLKDDEGEHHTYPVSGEALGKMDRFGAGTKAVVTFLDNDKGEPEEIIDIEKAEPDSR